jgi:hypothetical protein
VSSGGKLGGVSRSLPSLRTPTVSVSIRLALRGDAPAPAALFLPEAPQLGRAQLLDNVCGYLEEEREFLPVELDGMRALVNRAAIAYVAVARRPSGFDDDEVSDVHTLFDHRCPVAVTLEGGIALRGTLLFSSPADRARLIDFINLGPRFVRLWTSDELFLVQRSAIRILAELPGS